MIDLERCNADSGEKNCQGGDGEPTFLRENFVNLMIKSTRPKQAFRYSINITRWSAGFTRRDKSVLFWYILVRVYYIIFILNLFFFCVHILFFVKCSFTTKTIMTLHNFLTVNVYPHCHPPIICPAIHFHKLLSYFTDDIHLSFLHSVLSVSVKYSKPYCCIFVLIFVRTSSLLISSIHGILVIIQ